jgi:hypothetical protein
MSGYPGAARVSITEDRTVKVVIRRDRPQYSRGGSKLLTMGDVEVQVFFGPDATPTALPNNNYIVHVGIFNSADNRNLAAHITGYVYQKSQSFFWVRLSAPPPTGNYYLEWSIAENYNP